MEGVLPKLRDIDVERLSGGATTQAAAHRAEAAEQLRGLAEAALEAKGLMGVPRKNDVSAVDAARERYLARKAGKTPRK